MVEFDFVPVVLLRAVVAYAPYQGFVSWEVDFAFESASP